MPKDDQRPTDPMTAADALKLIEALKTTLREEIQKINARMANIQGAMITMSEIMQALSADLSETRVKRREEELFEVDQEEEILQKRLNIVLAKKEMKHKDTPPSQDTNERFKKLAVSTYLEKEKLEEEKKSEWWRDTFRQAGRTIIITLSVSGVIGLVGFLWWLFQFYLSSR